MKCRKCSDSICESLQPAKVNILSYWLYLKEVCFFLLIIKQLVWNISYRRQRKLLIQGGTLATLIFLLFYNLSCILI